MKANGAGEYLERDSVLVCSIDVVVMIWKTDVTVLCRQTNSLRSSGSLKNSFGTAV